MQIKNENGIKWISCDDLGELVEEFKKFRTAEIEGNRKKDWNSYHFFRVLGLRIDKEKKRVLEEIDKVPVFQKNGVDLALNIAPLNWTKKDWKPYDEKVKKILKEIWETGEVKNYQGLDLSWPATSLKTVTFCDQCHKYIGDDRKLAYFSDVEKDLDFCSESCHSKFKTKDELEKENQGLKRKIEKETSHKNVWMIIAIMAISIFVLTLLFSWIKLKKLKKK